MMQSVIRSTDWTGSQARQTFVMSLSHLKTIWRGSLNVGARAQWSCHREKHAPYSADDLNFVVSCCVVCQDSVADKVTQQLSGNLCLSFGYWLTCFCSLSLSGLVYNRLSGGIAIVLFFNRKTPPDEREYRWCHIGGHFLHFDPGRWHLGRMEAKTQTQTTECRNQCQPVRRYYVGRTWHGIVRRRADDDR